MRQACHSREGGACLASLQIHEKWKWRDLLLPLTLKGETGEQRGGINESCVLLVRRSNGDQVDQVDSVFPLGGSLPPVFQSLRSSVLRRKRNYI